MTPSKTPFAGYELLQPGDPLSSDGFAFQAQNPLIADLMAKIGAVTHKHDGHAAMASPTTEPTVAVTTGGTVAALTAISVCYTLIDPDGGESLPCDPVTVTTPGGFADPSDAPTGAVDYATGSLLAATYSYAITVTDGLGGETAIGPPLVITVNPTPDGTAAVDMSGLAAIVASVSGSSTTAGWRMWRVIGGSPWYLIGTGAYSVDTFVDTGISGDCSVSPPQAGTTGGSSAFTVIVPSTSQPPTATFINLYACDDGSFTSPCFLGQYPVSDYDDTETFTDLNPTWGQPPAVSGCLPGATPINPDTDLLNWGWKQPVALVADLPSSGNTDGDVRMVLASYLPYVWEAGSSAWAPFGTPVRQTTVTDLTGLTTGTEVAAVLSSLGKSMTIFAVTVDQPCRLRIYPTAAMATADIARSASTDPDVWAQNGCYFECTFSGAGTQILTPTIMAVNQETSPSDVIAANINPGAGTINVTLAGYMVEA